MEDAIYRKDAIKKKGMTKIKNNAGSAGTLRQELGGLERQIKESTASLDQYNDSINQYQDAYNQRLLEDQQLAEGMTEVKMQIQQLQEEYEHKVETKKVMLET